MILHFTLFVKISYFLTNKFDNKLFYIKGGGYLKDFLSYKAEAKKRQVEKGMTYKDLEKVTGYSSKTIEKFMCGAYTCSDEKIAKAIAEALDIPEYMAT